MTVFEEHKTVIDAARETLMAAVHIKEDPEFIKAMAYMKVQKMRGKIKEAPCKENNYSIRMG